MIEALPTWAQDNLLLGFLLGFVTAFAGLAIWEYAATGIQWQQRRRARKIAELARARKAHARHGGAAAPRPDGPRRRPAPAPAPPEPPAGPILGEDTQAMPAIKNSMFAAPPPALPLSPLVSPPPPPLPPSELVPAVPQESERRGRHASPTSGRRRRRDDPHKKYEDGKQS